MSLIDEFADEMLMTVSIQPFSGNDGYKDTYGTAVDYPCIAIDKIKVITKEDGIETVSTMHISVDGEQEFTIKDKITYKGKSPKILLVQKLPDIEHMDQIYKTIIYT